MNLDEFATASKVKDIIARVVLDILKIERPSYTYATVVAVDFVNSTVQVQYRPDEDPVTLPAVGALPSVPGQIVKIDGDPGDRHVVAVMKEPGLGEVPSVFIPYHYFDHNDADFDVIDAFYGLRMGEGDLASYPGTIDIPIWWKSTAMYAIWVPVTSTAGNVDLNVQVINQDLTVHGGNFGPGSSYTITGRGGTYPTQGRAVVNRSYLGELPAQGRLRVTINRFDMNPTDTYNSDIILGGMLFTRTA